VFLFSTRPSGSTAKIFLVKSSDFSTEVFRSVEQPRSPCIFSGTTYPPVVLFLFGMPDLCLINREPQTLDNIHTRCILIAFFKTQHWVLTRLIGLVPGGPVRTRKAYAILFI
jgi:hypothetical protein